MRQADAAPGEDRGEAADVEHPGEGGFLRGAGGQVGEQAEGGGERDGRERAAAPVDVREEARRLMLFGQGGEGARRAVHGRVADREHGQHDNAVHDGVEALNPGVGDGDDEGGCTRVVGVGADEARIRVGDEQADEGQRDDVEDADPPEHLLDGRGERFTRVGCLGGGEAHELGAGESEGCRYEGGT